MGSYAGPLYGPVGSPEQTRPESQVGGASPEALSVPKEQEPDQDDEQRKDDVISDMRQFLFETASFENRTRIEALEDLRFKIGDQWADNQKKEREILGRPYLVFNMIPKFVEQIMGDARKNSMSIQVHPADSEGDPLVAAIIEDNIRNIEYVSDAHQAQNTALEAAVDCGFGYFGIEVVYSDDDTFDQDINFRNIKNAFTVYYDPWCRKNDGSDAKQVIVTELISQREFNKKYPRFTASAVDSSIGDVSILWWTQEQVRICEYWRKEPIKKTLYKVQVPKMDPMTGQTTFNEITITMDGATPYELKPGESVVDQREVTAYQVRCYLCSGVDVLEEWEWPGKYIPIFRILGKEVNINGEVVRRGIIRDMKDPQRMFNYWYTDITERIALAPKTPMFVTPKMIEGHEEQWNQANRIPYPYLFYNENPSGAPHQEPPPQIETGRVEMLKISSQAMKDVSGLYDASLGAKSNETSGIAIRSRQQQGDTATYYFLDNFADAVELAGKCLVDLIPKVYTSKRMIRLRSKDGSSQMVPINQPVGIPQIGPNGQPVTNQMTGEPEVDKRVFDMTIGKYDCIVTTGPSYSTQRQEQADKLSNVLQSVPQSAPVIIPRLFKLLDIEDSQTIGDEMKQLLNPQPVAPPAPAPGAPQDAMAPQPDAMSPSPFVGPGGTVGPGGPALPGAPPAGPQAMPQVK